MQNALTKTAEQLKAEEESKFREQIRERKVFLTLRKKHLRYKSLAKRRRVIRGISFIASTVICRS